MVILWFLDGTNPKNSTKLKIKFKLGLKVSIVNYYPGSGKLH